MANDIGPHLRVRFNYLPLLGIELAGFIEYLIADAQFADIMQQGANA